MPRRRRSNIFVFDEILLGGAALAAAGAAARKLRDRHRKQIEDALDHVEAALDRHERHLTGEEPTDARSQEQLMRELEDAREALVKALESEEKEERKGRKKKRRR